MSTTNRHVRPQAQPTNEPWGRQRRWIVASGYAAVLLVFGLLGSNPIVYLVSMLGIPISVGWLLARRALTLWSGAAVFAAFLILDWVRGDSAKPGDLPFFAAVAVVWTGIAVLVRFVVTRRHRTRQARAAE